MTLGLLESQVGDDGDFMFSLPHKSFFLGSMIPRYPYIRKTLTKFRFPYYDTKLTYLPIVQILYTIYEYFSLHVIYLSSLIPYGPSVP